jgi:hypothetical protein
MNNKLAVIAGAACVTAILAGMWVSSSGAQQGSDVLANLRPDDQVEFERLERSALATFNKFQSGTREYDANRQQLGKLYDDVTATRNVTGWVCQIGSVYRAIAVCNDPNVPSFTSSFELQMDNGQSSGNPKVYQGDIVKFSGLISFNSAELRDDRYRLPNVHEYPNLYVQLGTVKILQEAK